MDTPERGIRNYRGTKDWFGDEVKWRQEVIAQIRASFESFGFEPLETPVLETEDTLSGKYGEEGEAKRFRLSKIFPEEGGLRYDHTVPLARFMAMHWNEFPLPYRRYVIGPVFRDETVQAGRYREFTQCDFDTIGSVSPVIDAEAVVMNYNVLTRLGFTDNFVVRVNDRKLLNAMVRGLGIQDRERALTVFRSWDKLEKAEMSQIREELESAEMSAEEIAEFEAITDALFAVTGETADRVLSTVYDLFDSEEAQLSVKALEEIADYVIAMGVPEDRFRLWPLLARGLDYYTGPIFETVVEEKGLGSITGGGRYDKLISQMGGPDMPASGSSFGLERIMEVMQDLGLKPESSQTTQVFVTLFDLDNAELCQTSFRIANELRLTGYRVEMYTGEASKLGKQLDIANRKGVPLATILGPDELRQGTITLKDLTKERGTGTQVTIPADNLLKEVKNRLE